MLLLLSVLAVAFVAVFIVVGAVVLFVVLPVLLVMFVGTVVLVAGVVLVLDWFVVLAGEGIRIKLTLSSRDP